MAQPESLEGTGEQLQRHLQQHPNEWFRLVRVANDITHEREKSLSMQEEISLEEEGRLFDELAALGRDLPGSSTEETYSRETIYADHD